MRHYTRINKNSTGRAIQFPRSRVTEEPTDWLELDQDTERK